MTEATHAEFLSTARRGEVARWSRTLIPTAREAPADAETPSHILMVRAGLIRRVGAGIYDYLPLGWRAIRKVSQIVREEMDAIGASEMLMPTLEPIELFAGSKRDVDYGDLLFKLEDRHGRVAALGPTHEEVITELMTHAITSYKQLPLSLYQIQTKFRDEFRPRAGLLRCREFLMKDAYSFHLTVDGDGGLNATYDDMYAAYARIFERCGLEFTVVEAESGPIGGSASHEFMVNAPTGEDTILRCPASGYAANVEKCEIGERPWCANAAPDTELKEHHTPNMPGIELVAGHLGVTASQMLKTLVFEPKEPAEGGPAWVLVTVRGDHEVNEGKVRDAAGFAVQLADEKKAKAAGFAIGYVSPKMAQEHANTLLLIDPDALNGGSWATGADKPDHHVTGFNWSRDLAGVVPASGDSDRVKVRDLRNAVAGDPSPRDPGSVLEEQRGIEVGHIFKLGSKYSDAMGFQVLDPDQRRQSVIMGCYGIGVSRTVASSIEQNHDDNGIIWPAPIAPYHVHIVVMKPGDERQERVCAELAEGLAAQGIDVFIDDRPERPGVKFKDADLIGLPVRITLGDKALDQDSVEFKKRTDEGKGELVAIDDAVGTCARALVARA